MYMRLAVYVTPGADGDITNVGRGHLEDWGEFLESPDAFYFLRTRGWGGRISVANFGSWGG